MPPKGSGVKLDEKEWFVRANGAEGACRICSAGLAHEAREWIKALSGPRHQQSEGHWRALKAGEDAAMRLRAREAELREEAAAWKASSVRLDAPVPKSRVPNVPSMAEVEMWQGFEEFGAAFSAGEVKKDAAMGHDNLEHEAEVFGILDPEGAASRLGFGEVSLEDEMRERDEEEDFLSELLHNAGISDPTEADVQAAGGEIPAPTSEYFPYPNKTLRKIQKEIRAESGVPSIPCISPLGNVFFMNDPREIIKHDWANPSTRKLIHVYPEVPEDGIVSEIWHAEKWRKNMDLDALSPMYDGGRAHFYVNEVACLKDGRFVVPIRWIIYHSAVHADCHEVTVNEVGEAIINTSDTTLIPASEFVEKYLDLMDNNTIPNWSPSTIDGGLPAQMPNPKRKIAGGYPLYTSLVDYFGDDVSGNRSKSWNKHWNAYMTHRNLPRKLLQQEFHVHFISTSPNASITEQYREFKAAVESTHSDPVTVTDEAGSITKVMIYCNAGPSDNPMQSEISGHIGGTGNCYCRKCKVGGSKVYKASDKGYHELFEPGVPRTKTYVLEQLRHQVAMACGGSSLTSLQKDQRRTGVKDAYTQKWIVGLTTRFTELQAAGRSNANIKAELMQWSNENEEKIYSAFLTTKAFDPTQDTPIELLHTILLGAVKYVWHISHSAWPADKKECYALRLQATEIDGLSIHPIRANYIMQYANSLIGKQLKTIVQTGIFHVYDLVSDDHLIAWRALGELSALLWFTEIRNLAEYQSDLKTAVANLLDAIAVIDPSKIITKIKYHLLTHTPDDAAAFGPLIGLATELFESFNAVFRYCSILSNHLAPSRDIASQLGNQEGFKHRLTGGRWLSKMSGRWERAGPGVHHFLEKHLVIQKLLGWAPQTANVAGDVKLMPLKRGQPLRVQQALSTTRAVAAVNYSDFKGDSAWDRCRSVFSQSLDECYVNSWVFAESPTEVDVVICGRITEILVGPGGGLVVLERFRYSSVRDPIYGMPILTRPNDEMISIILRVEKLKFKFNVQHDCNVSGCKPIGIRAVMQERVQSTKKEHYIVHSPLERYIINMHSFHNAHFLRATLPRSLWAPQPLFPDRAEKHVEFAAQLRTKTATCVTKPITTASGNVGIIEQVGEVGEAGRTREHLDTDERRGQGIAHTARSGPAAKKTRKRRRSPDASEEEEAWPPPRKRGRPRKTKPMDVVTPVVALAISSNIAPSLAAGRAKRTIRPSARVLAAQEAEIEAEDDDSSADSEDYSEEDEGPAEVVHSDDDDYEDP